MTSDKKLTIAALGPEGTFTQEAACAHFGQEILLFSSIEEVFSAVEEKRVDYGVVPVENSTEGTVTRTLDRFIEYLDRSDEKLASLQVTGEIMYPIQHNLLSQCSALHEVREVYAHQQGLAQCRAWLMRYLPHVQLVSVSSNAEGARRASLIPGTAAIAGQKAAELYGLSILYRAIQDDLDNTTRFWVLGHQKNPAAGSSVVNDKTSLLITVLNRPGILYQALEPFARHGIDMLSIQSRPSRKSQWDYVFFIDVKGHCERPDLAAALEDLRKKVARVKVLGSYPLPLQVPFEGPHQE